MPQPIFTGSYKKIKKSVERATVDSSFNAEKDTIINDDEKFKLIQWKNDESAVTRFGLL